MVRSRFRTLSRLLVLAAIWIPLGVTAQAPTPDGVATLVRRLEQAAATGDTRAILALGASTISRPSFEDFAGTLSRPVPTRLVIFERDRRPLGSGGQRIIIEVFVERGIEAQVSTWTLDLRPGDTGPDPWRIGSVSRLSVVTGLYRLSLNPARQYDVHDLTMRAPDLTVEMTTGRAFVAETPEGVTAVVLFGRGRIHFTPPDLAEQTQVRIFSGGHALTEDIDMAFVRLAPGEFAARFNPAALKPRAVDPTDLRTATAVFNDYIGRSLQINLNDFSPERWSLTPAPGDVIAEMRTKRFGTLTYARSGNDAEDITVFDRRRRRNISVYASAAKLAQRGRFYDEDDLTDYDVLAYDIDAEITPDRGVMQGNARLKVKIRNDGATSLTFRLAESLVVRGVYSPEFGRLLHLRVVGQNSLIVNLPARVAAGTEMWIDVAYGGPLAPQSFEPEAMQLVQDPPEQIPIPVERRFLYSNRSYWYPQSVVTDYATAHLRITVPSEFDVVATGDPVAPPAPAPEGAERQRRRKVYVFDADKPARYLAILISRFNEVDSTRLAAGGTSVALYVKSNPRQVVRLRTMLGRAAEVFKFYATLLGDAPYPSFTLALMESDRPGGHSPPYFALLNQVSPSSHIVWRNDPVSFTNYPAFFLAHEVAHQWWGHAVGWKNYHEQWISEGMAQYFAALYAERDPDGSQLPGVLRQMRRTAIASAADGPIYLGYRLGHIQGDDRI
ncbi:MAG: M1 family aminopeptidase, partial [Acidobacteriota bacterium]